MEMLDLCEDVSLGFVPGNDVSRESRRRRAFSAARAGQRSGRGRRRHEGQAAKFFCRVLWLQVRYGALFVEVEAHLFNET